MLSSCFLGHFARCLCCDITNETTSRQSLGCFARIVPTILSYQIDLRYTSRNPGPRVRLLQNTPRQATYPCGFRNPGFFRNRVQIIEQILSSHNEINDSGSGFIRLVSRYTSSCTSHPKLDDLWRPITAFPWSRILGIWWYNYQETVRNKSFFLGEKRNYASRYFVEISRIIKYSIGHFIWPNIADVPTYPPAPHHGRLMVMLCGSLCQHVTWIYLICSILCPATALYLVVRTRQSWKLFS